MPWSESKRLKIVVMRDAFRKQDMVVEFCIADDKREAFHRELEYMLAACQTAGAEFSFDEVHDLESGELFCLEIQLIGNQQEIAGAVKSRVQSLQPLSVWVR